MSFPMRMLKELGTIHTGSTPKTNDDSLFGGDVPFVTPGDLGDVTPIEKTSRTLTDAGVQTAELLPAGAVLVCCIGSLGKTGFTGRSVVTNQQITAVIFDTSKMDARFGFFACRMLKPQLEVMAPATTVPIVNKSRFSEMRIPVPPLTEQRRIAAILDQAETLRTQRRAALAQLDSLTQSIFLDMFGDPVANPRGFDVCPLAAVSKFENGDRSSNYPSGDDIKTSGVLFLSTKNIVASKLDLSKPQFITQEKFDSLSRGKARPGDLVITLRGTLGSCCVFDCEQGAAFINAQMMIIRPTGKVIGQYLHTLLTSDEAKAHFDYIGGGAAVPQLTAAQLGELKVLIPPLALQQTFATRIQAIEALKTTHRAALAELDALFASLQQRAFAGEL